MGNFTQNISAFCQKTGLRADQVLRVFAMEALKGVVMKTPVDTGRCRGSWRVSLGAADLSVEPATTSKAKDGGAAAAMKAISAGTAIIAGAKFGSTIVISNNVPYAGALEAGHSQQAPAGMLAVTFAELKAYAARIVAQASSGAAAGSSPTGTGGTP